MGCSSSESKQISPSPTLPKRGCGYTNTPVIQIQGGGSDLFKIVFEEEAMRWVSPLRASTLGHLLASFQDAEAGRMEELTAFGRDRVEPKECSEPYR